MRSSSASQIVDPGVSSTRSHAADTPEVEHNRAPGFVRLRQLVLVVESNAELSEALRAALIENGLDAMCGDVALAQASAASTVPPPVDAILVDIDGLDPSDVLLGRQRGAVPVIQYSVRKREPRLEIQTVNPSGGLEPPMGLGFFCRYVRTAIRPPVRLPPNSRTQVGVLRLDTATYRVHIDGKEVLLTALEFRLLVVVLSAGGRLLSREALLDQVWGIRRRVDTRTVDTHMKRLRQKLGQAASLIQTVRGFGYRSAGA